MSRTYKDKAKKSFRLMPVDKRTLTEKETYAKLTNLATQDFVNLPLLLKVGFGQHVLRKFNRIKNNNDDV